MTSADDKDLDQLLNESFAGRVVRKDLTKLIKEGLMSRSMCLSIFSVCTVRQMMTR